MKLIKESIKGFRNIREAEFSPSTAVTVICGENGQGKTNLLESIFMLTGAKRLNEAAHAEILAGQESLILREMGTQLTPGTVTLRLGDREETIEVFFSGEGDAVFFPEVGP